MPQQINLFTPILLTQKRYFSAQTVFQALTILVFFGGGLYAYLIFELGVAREELKKTLALEVRELESLHLAIKQNQLGGSAAGTASALVQAQRIELLRVEKILAALQQGLIRPGEGHAARLELLAQTIPANVWITQLSDEERQLKISGFTFEPALLEMWIDKLALNPLLKGQTLQAVTVESVSAGLETMTRPSWSFSFIVALKRPVDTAEAKP